MGGAIAKGIAAGSLVPASDLTVTAHTQQTLDKIKGYDPAIRTTLDNREAVQGADLVVLAVKPWLLEEVVKEIRGGLDYRKQAVASVIGRSSFEELGKLLDNGSGVMPVMYRIIPNTAISLGESVTFIAEQGAPKERLDELVSIFSELGQTVVVKEPMMGPGTSLASCGIAFALKYLDASIQGGVELGFAPEEARGCRDADDARGVGDDESERHDAADRDRQGDHSWRNDAQGIGRDGREWFYRSRQGGTFQ